MTPEAQRGQIRFIYTPDGRVPEAAGLQVRAGALLGVSATQTRPCMVPLGGPLFEHRSAIENVVLLASLSGRRCDRATAVYWLRRVEVPDVLHESSAASLPAVCRLGIWLAVAHLTEPEILVLENPFGPLDTESAHCFVRLLAEMSSLGRGVVVTGSDPSIARLLSATVADEFSRI